MKTPKEWAREALAARDRHNPTPTEVRTLASFFRKAMAEQRETDALIAARFAICDLDYAERYPDEARKMEDLAHRAKTIEDAIRAQGDSDV